MKPNAKTKQTVAEMPRAELVRQQFQETTARYDEVVSECRQLLVMTAEFWLSMHELMTDDWDDTARDVRDYFNDERPAEEKKVVLNEQVKVAS